MKKKNNNKKSTCNIAWFRSDQSADRSLNFILRTNCQGWRSVSGSSEDFNAVRSTQAPHNISRLAFIDIIRHNACVPYFHKKLFFHFTLRKVYIYIYFLNAFRKLSGHNVLGFALNIARFHPAMWRFRNWIISVLAWGVTFFHIIWDPSISKKGRQWKNNEKKKEITPAPLLFKTHMWVTHHILRITVKTL